METKGKEKKETAMTVQENTGYLARPLSQELTKSQKELIKRCFAKNATDDELDLYYNFCEKAGVDPLRGQSHFIKYKPNDKPIMMIGIDGFQKRATIDSRYVGMVANAVYENDEFKMSPVMGEIEHSFGVKDRGKIMGAYAMLRRNGMETAVIWVNFVEYDTGYNVWTTKPDVMIVKVAKSSLLRREYPDNFSNVYAPEEFGAEITEDGDFIDHTKDITPKKEEKPKAKPKKIEHKPAVKICATKICGNPIPDDSPTGVCAKCLGEVQDAEFTEEVESDAEEPDNQDDRVRDIPDGLIDDTMKPRDALKEIMIYAMEQEIGDITRPIFCKHYEPWATGSHYTYNIPETAIIKIVDELTGIKLKKVEKAKKCSNKDCGAKTTEPEMVEQDKLCRTCYMEAQEND